MKDEPKLKKLVLKKETLRDLTTANADQVKAGVKGGGGNTYPTICIDCSYLTCNTHYASCKGCGGTKNKRCA